MLHPTPLSLCANMAMSLSRLKTAGCLQAWAVSWRRPCCARIPRRCRCGTPTRPRLPPHLLRDRRQRLPQPACWRGCRCRLAARSAPRRPPRCSAGCLRAGGRRPQRADANTGLLVGLLVLCQLQKWSLVTCMLMFMAQLQTANCMFYFPPSCAGCSHLGLLCANRQSIVGIIRVGHWRAALPGALPGTACSHKLGQLRT